MRRGFMPVVVASATAAAVIVIWLTAQVAADQTPRYIPPGTPDGKVDLNGIWQALNTANYDLQAHSARAAMALRPGPAGPIPAAGVLPLGAVGAVPAGLSVVDGDEIPYQPAALAKKKQNADNWRTSDPEIKCYMPGVPRATYMPYPFQIIQNDRDPDRLWIRRARSAPSTWTSRSRNRRRSKLDGPLARPLGRRYAGRRSRRFQRPGVVRSRRQLRERRAAGSRAIHTGRPDHLSTTRPRSKTRRSSRGRGRSACHCTGALKKARGCMSSSASSLWRSCSTATCASRRSSDRARHSPPCPPVSSVADVYLSSARFRRSTPPKRPRPAADPTAPASGRATMPRAGRPTTRSSGCRMRCG